jgi:hypothetical protein
LCERLKVQPAELGYIEREQAAGVVEEHAKPEPATPKPTPTPATVDDTLKVFDRWLLLKDDTPVPCSAPSPPTTQATRSRADRAALQPDRGTDRLQPALNIEKALLPQRGVGLRCSGRVKEARPKFINGNAARSLHFWLGGLRTRHDRDSP